MHDYAYGLRPGCKNMPISFGLLLSLQLWLNPSFSQSDDLIPNPLGFSNTSDSTGNHVKEVAGAEARPRNKAFFAKQLGGIPAGVAKILEIGNG